MLTLALAIGANAVVFSIMNTFVLRPLNVPDAQSLYELQHGDEASENQSYPNYLDLRDRNHTFASVIASNINSVGLDTGEIPPAPGSWRPAEIISTAWACSRTWAISSTPPTSTVSTARPTWCWATHSGIPIFRTIAGVVGRVVQLDRHPFTIIGVAPPGFRGTLLFFDPDFYVPIVNHPQTSEPMT